MIICVKLFLKVFQCKQETKAQLQQQSDVVRPSGWSAALWAERRPLGGTAERMIMPTLLEINTATGDAANSWVSSQEQIHSGLSPLQKLERSLHPGLDPRPENLVSLRQSDPRSSSATICYTAKRQHRYYV